MRLVIASLILAVAPLFGAGHPLAPPSYGMSPYSTSLGGTATNGRTFLTVWHHWTNGNGTTIFGVLTNADGSPISDSSFEIVTLPNHSLGIFTYLCQPVASADGYVLFWSTTEKTEMARLTDEGVIRERRVLDLPPQVSGTVTASGDQFFFRVHRTNSTTGYLLDRDGSILLGDILMPWSVLDYTITAVPDGFALTARDSSGIWTERIARDGTFGKRIPVALASESGWIETASHGSTLGIVWASAPNLWLATVDAEGKVQRTVVRSGYGSPSSPPDSLSRVAAGWIVFTRSELALVGDDGRLRSTAQTGSSFAMEVATNDTHIHATTEEALWVNGGWSLRAVSKTWQSPTLTRVATGAVSRTLVSHVAPMAVQTAGGGHLVAWNSRALSSHAIEVGALVPGETSIRTVYEHGRTTRADGISSFALGTNGAQSLLVWNENRTLYGRILDPNGGPMGERFLVGLGTFERPAIEWTGAGWVVAWPDDAVTTVHVTTTGVVSNSLRVRPKLTPPATWLSLDGLDLEWNGTHLLALATRGNGRQDQAKAILFRLDAMGALDGDAVLELPRPVRRASLATNGKDWLVVSDERGAATATVVDSELRAGVATKFFDWINEWLLPFTSDVDWNGSEYVVAIRHGEDDEHWLAMHRLNRAGAPTTVPVVARVGAPDLIEPPSVAGNVAVFAAFNTGAAERTTMVTPGDLAFVAPPSAPPRNARFVGRNVERIEVAWEDHSDNERGFVIETHDGVDWIEAGRAPAGATRGTAYAKGSDRMRVRAWNEGGVSAPSGDATPTPRRRSAR